MVFVLFFECFFWYRSTWVVPDQRPLNGCVCCVLVFLVIGECMLFVLDLVFSILSQEIGLWETSLK